MTKYYGQFETDRIIESYFDMRIPGTFIEVGAYDGVKGSNCKYFEDHGWRGICIEPNPYVFPLLVKNRPYAECLMLACSNRGGEYCYEDFTIYNFESGIQSSLSSLETDERLIHDYKDAIESKEIIKVETRRLIDIVSNFISLTSKGVDILSVDTEGDELKVIEGLNLYKCRPKLIVLENNYEDKIFRSYMLDYGYKLDQRHEVNDFYIRIKP